MDNSELLDLATEPGDITAQGWFRALVGLTSALGIGLALISILN